MADSLVTFWRHGFEGSSVEELERATGLGRSSLYNTFGNKRALFLAALDRYAQAFQEGPLGILMHGTAGLDDLLAFYTALGGHQDADAPTGCLMVNSLVELGSVADPDVQRDLLAPGRYQIRVQATPEGGRVPLNISTDATVPGDQALLGTAAVVSRRGPGTGRLFQPTADPRFRRTERLIVETPVISKDATIHARLLNKVGQPMEIPVTLSEKLDESLQLRTSVAEIALAPLAAGEYVVEVAATKGDATERVSYALRIIP